MAKEPFKELDISAHAGERMLQRHISNNQAAGVIRAPSRVLAGNTDYTKRFERDFPNGRTLVVIAEERETTFRLVTAYWDGE